LPIFGYERLRDLQSLGRMAARGLGYVGSLLPKLLWRQPPLPTEPEEARARTFWLNLVNLKQFRDAEDPDAACYQAIVNSRMDVDRYNGGGLLFNPLRGDPSGGFHIRIYHEQSQPIIESLGLEVAEEAMVEGRRAATLRPLLALWLDGDVSYGTGEALCRRTRNSSWDTGTGRGEPANDSNAYNTTQGAALAEMPGPFFFPNSTIRVLPLMADAERLGSFCAAYLDNEHYRFEPWGSCVYLTASSHEDVSAETESLGSLTLREVSFLVPVKWYDRAGKLLSVALVAPFGYMDDETAAITAHEVYGLEVAQAAIESPANAWMNDAGPIETRQPLLRLTTAVLPALYLGRKAEQRRLVEVQEADALASSEDPVWRFIAQDWGQRLVADHRRKVATKEKYPAEFVNSAALAIELLAHGEYVNSIALKQFRDCEEPNRACYQALILNRRSIKNIFDIREIEGRIHVRIDRYPTQPIVERLGLAVKWTDSTSGPTAIDILQPIRPFWMKVAMKQGLSRNLSWRAGTKLWKTEAAPPLYFSRSDETRTRVGESLPHDIDGARQRGQDLKTAADQWFHAAVLEDAAALTEAAAADSSKGVEALAAAIGGAKAEDANLLMRFVRLLEAGGAGATRANRGVDWLEGSFESGELARLVELLREAGLQADNRPSKRLGCGAALSAIETIEPQMVIESILSRRWEDRGESGGRPGRGARGDFRIRIDSVAKPFSDSLFAAAKRSDDGEWYSEDVGEHAGKEEESSKRRR